MQNCQRSCDDYWSPERLCQMKDKRASLWADMVRDEEVPQFLVDWHDEVMSASWNDPVDYDWFRSLIQDWILSYNMPHEE